MRPLLEELTTLAAAGSLLRRAAPAAGDGEGPALLALLARHVPLDSPLLQGRASGGGRGGPRGPPKVTPPKEDAKVTPPKDARPARI